MLSKKAKYGIHALVHLARHADEGPLLISTISEKEHIPKKFLETILLELKMAGILHSKKGKGGGYYLAKKPAEVNLAEVIRLFDGAIALLPCATFKFYEKCDECEDEETCAIRNVIKEVRDASIEILSQNTLEDVLVRERKLQKKAEKKTKKGK